MGGGQPPRSPKQGAAGYCGHSARGGGKKIDTLEEISAAITKAVRRGRATVYGGVSLHNVKT